MTQRPFPARSLQAGFTIVEMMVGVLIGLIAIVIMFQLFAVSEAQRRTTTGAGDAQQNGVTSLFLMERDARMAGFGFNYAPMLGCDTFGVHAPTNTVINFRLTPALVRNGGAGLPDQVTFIYGSADSYALPGSIAIATNTYAGQYFKLKDPRYQFRSGDLIVVGEVPVGAAAMKRCAMVQVTSLPPFPESEFLRYGAGSYLDENFTSKIAEYNNPGPFPDFYLDWKPATSSGGRIFNLGRSPVAVTYSVVNNQLVANDAFQPGQQQIISDGIVHMRAQYGFSWNCPPTPAPPPPAFEPCRISAAAVSIGTINPASNVDQWGDQMPANARAADWRRVIAVRMALVARSMTPERKDPVSGTCVTTTSLPIWQTTGQMLSVGNDPDWGCYRYRVFEMMVPIRNLMWYADPTGTTIPPTS